MPETNEMLSSSNSCQEGNGPDGILVPFFHPMTIFLIMTHKLDSFVLGPF